MKRLAILGTRGVPGAHGGFETFAEQLSLFLVARGWEVSVYCQVEGGGPVETSDWRGVRRIVIPAKGRGAASTVLFDWRATLHAAREDSTKLVLGYNTALFNALLRIRGRPTVTNMDGIEWKRDKWGPGARAWFYVNEWFGCRFSHHLVADHPEIQRHLERWADPAKITMIPYGAREVVSADPGPLDDLGLEAGRYFLVIARPEPENSILQIVRAWSRRPRPFPLVVLGNYDPAHPFHRSVKAAASESVVFPGAIYDAATVDCLRCHAAAYVHGHTVGGTNPSLVEALGAGCPVIAHDNRFNRWVAGDAGVYFADEAQLADIFDQMLAGEDRLRRLSGLSCARFRSNFTWDSVLARYETLLAAFEEDRNRGGASHE